MTCAACLPCAAVGQVGANAKTIREKIKKLSCASLYEGSGTHDTLVDTRTYTLKVWVTVKEACKPKILTIVKEA